MKILYVSDERRGAGRAARALHGIAPNVTLTWAQTWDSALQWVHGNADAAAVLVEGEVQGQCCAPFVEQIRALGLAAPVVVVVAAARMEPPFPALNAGADGCVIDGPSLEADLPPIVMAAVDRERARRSASDRKLADLEGSRDRAEQRLARAEQERQQTDQLCASELTAAAARLADVQARHSASLAREARICTALQQRLLELETALRTAEERRASEAVASADQLARRHGEFTASLAQAAEWRDALTAKLSVAAAALDEAQAARRTEAAAAAEHLARREEELEAALAEAVAARTALERALTDAAAAQRDAQERGEADLAAATERQAALEDLLAQEADARTVLEQKLAAAEAARREAEHRHATELTTTAMRLADVQARYDATLGENAAARAAFEERLAEAASALERSRRERDSEAEAAAEQLARREAELTAALAEAEARRTALEFALTEAQAAHRDAMQRADAAIAEHAAARAAFDQQLTDAAAALERTRQEQAAESAAAAGRLAQREAELAGAVAAAAEREAELTGKLASESEMRAALERDLVESSTDSARARFRLLDLVSAHRRRAGEQRTWFEAQLAGARADADRALGAKDEEIEKIRLDREALQHMLGTTQEQLQHLHGTVDEERQAYERARLNGESELRRVSAEYDRLRQSLDQLQTAFQTLEQIAGEHAAERARLERVVADRDEQLSAQAARHLTAEQAARETLVKVRETLRQALDTSSSEIARLQQEIDRLRQERDAVGKRAEALRGEARRVPGLQAQLDASEKEGRRLFERAPHGLCRCSREGVILDANHSLVRLLGYRRADELRNMNFAAAVFECAGDLGWLIERTVATGRAHTVETGWKARDGRRLVVRLQALATANGSVEVVIEDLTNVRALEERIRQAQRMEAVGRLASEVAVTCDTLLRDVSRDGREWLSALGGDSPLRHRTEALLSEVTRAASFLQQLTVYGNEQARALEPVSVRRILRDLAPVLKTVLGEGIELVLSKTSASFDVDVDAQRVERVLVNAVSYARERMRSGGQVRIGLGETVIGQRIVSRHPDVRPGPHVLITVAELANAALGDAPIDLDGSAARDDRSLPERPGVDLGALVELIGKCGGHLWVEAEPAGNMILKIHLPKRAPAASSVSGVPEVRADRGGRLTRWFRTTSAVTRS